MPSSTVPENFLQSPDFYNFGQYHGLNMSIPSVHVWKHTFQFYTFIVIGVEIFEKSLVLDE